METIFHGKNLDKSLPCFHSLNVEGRGLFAPSLDTEEVPGRDGTLVMGKALPERVIILHFAIKASSSKEHLDTMRALNILLKSEGEEKLTFTDEEGYFLGQVSEVEAPPYNQWEGQGSISFYCADPFLHVPKSPKSGSNVTLDSKAYRLALVEAKIEATGSPVTLKNTSTGDRIAFSTPLTGTLSISKERILLGQEDIVPALDYTVSTWKGFTLRPEDTLMQTGGKSMVVTYEELYL